MKISNGIDLIEINRITKSIENPRFIERVFSEAEIQLFREKDFSTKTIAANFAAKEAFSKSLGTGVRGFSLNEISVLRDSLGRPYFAFSGKAEKLVSRLSLDFSVSLTHTENYAAAVVTAFT